MLKVGYCGMVRCMHICVDVERMGLEIAIAIVSAIYSARYNNVSSGSPATTC